jgi:hypothetical protein
MKFNTKTRLGLTAHLKLFLHAQLRKIFLLLSETQVYSIFTQSVVISAEEQESRSNQFVTPDGARAARKIMVPVIRNTGLAPQQQKYRYLLVDSHCGHGIAGVGIIGQHVEDAAAVEEEPALANHQDLGGVQGAARQSCISTPI